MALDPARMMTAAGLPPDEWQADLLRSRPSQALLLCTRQAGKSTTTAILALHEAVYYGPSLVLLLSPSLRQSSELFRKVMDFYQVLDLPVKANQTSALRLELENGSRIIALPGTEQTIRGYSGVGLLVIDEAARVDDPLYYSVRPMLAVSGGRLVCLSTPFGRRGWFYDAWISDDLWKRFKITADQCPRISPEFLKQERRSIGDMWYRQEYECNFMDAIAQVFSGDLVAEAFTSSVKPLFSLGSFPDISRKDEDLNKPTGVKSLFEEK